MKRNQLATPAGLDQDYNYLKKVERTIDRASQDSKERHGRKTLASTRNASRGWQPDSSLQKYLIEHRIQVERAPKGMTRQKLNHTRPTKSKRIVWTVEWIDQAGKRELQHDCLESESLGSIYKFHEVEKRNAARRQGADNGDNGSIQRAAKRKRSEARPSPQPADVKSDQVLISTADSLGDNQEGLELSAQEDIKTGAIKDIVELPEPVAIDHASPEQQPDQATSADPQRYFYLLKPATAVSSQVLIPLSTSSTLTSCLQDQTVQEYPTIITLSDSPESLPDGYILEEDYLRTRRAEDAELRSLERQHGGHASVQQSVQEETLDAKGILDMLKRDVRT